MDTQAIQGVCEKEKSPAAEMGERIKSLRKDNDMTQEELGLRLGVNRAAVNKYEKGTISNIPSNTLLKVCSIFGVTPNYLLLGETGLETHGGRKEVQQALSPNGAKCFSMLQIISEEGLLRVIPYLEDVARLYPREVLENSTDNCEVKAQQSEEQTSETLPLNNAAAEPNKRNKLDDSLSIAYYLARVNMAAVRELGYKTFKEAYEKLGELLGQKHTTIKNMRDEFDAHIDNGRVGRKRELCVSRKKVFERLKSLSDEELTAHIKNIISAYLGDSEECHVAPHKVIRITNANMKEIKRSR